MNKIILLIIIYSQTCLISWFPKDSPQVGHFLWRESYLALIHSLQNTCIHFSSTVSLKFILHDGHFSKALYSSNCFCKLESPAFSYFERVSILFFETLISS